jgi:hypothetical protein
MAAKNAEEENGSFLSSLKNTWLSEPSPEEMEEVDTSPPPSRSPFLSDLIKAYRKVQEGKGTKDELKRQVDSLRQRLQAASMAFNELYNSPHNEPAARKIAEKAHRAFNEHHEALDEMERFFHDGNAAHMEDGIMMASKCTDLLFEAYEDFNGLQREASMKICPQCNTKSEPHLKYCTKCGLEFPLINPAMRPGSGGSPFQADAKAGKDLLSGDYSIPTAFMGVYESLEKLRKNQMDSDTFIARVEDVKATFNDARPQIINILTKQLDKLKVDHDLKMSMLEIGKVLTDGIDEVLGGMDELISYTVSKNPRALVNGWNRVMNGGQQMLMSQTRYGELYSLTGARIATMGQSGEEQIANITREEIHIGEDEE